MSNRLVERPFGAVTAGDMRDRDARHQRRLRGGENLVTIAEHDQQIRLQGAERLRESGGRDTHRLADAGGAVVIERYLDFTVDDKSVVLDLAVGIAEGGR